MTVVTIKPINRKTSVPKLVIKKAVKAAILAHGKPKTMVVRLADKKHSK